MPRTAAPRKRIDPVPQLARDRCSICSKPDLFEWVERQLALGYPMAKIEEFSRQPGARDIGILPVKQETVSKHVKGCTARREVTKDRRRTPPPVPQRVYDLAAGAVAAMPQSDLATLIRDRVQKRIEDDPDIALSVKDGLKAQEMLDRRAEKAAGRELRLTLARLMTSLQPGADILPRRVGGDVIDGFAEAVVEEQRDTALLVEG